MNQFKNDQGFTLVEIVIAAGLLGALSLGVMSQIKHMAKGQATSEVKMEELEMRRIIATTLSDKTACQNTFLGTSIGSALTQIKNVSGGVMYQVGNTYGNNAVKITDMRTVDLGVLQNGTRVINLILGIEKAKKIVSSNTKNITIQLNVKALGASSPITECYADTEAMINSATQNACTSIGGVWSALNGLCTLPSCNPGEVLQAIAPNGVAICKVVGCKLGEVYVGLDAAGAPICKNISCSVGGTYFTGLDASGNPICQPATYN